MIPISLDPRFVRTALVGRGRLTAKRLAWLRALGVEPQLFSDAPGPELAGEPVLPRLPQAEDFAAMDVLWAADLSPAEHEALAASARAARVLVNVEDVLPLCDFHTPAVVRRGRLVLAASTGGASPAAAGIVREKLAAAFPQAWAEALEEISALRLALRAAAVGPEEIARRTRARLAELGLL